MSELVAIIIPIYKSDLTSTEKLSLKQCFNLFKNFPIIFIGPAKLNISEYETIADGHNFGYEPFADKYFVNIAGYNQLMLSPIFYRSFLKYKFILIYQLDSFVFKDELVYWCNLNYDYIGAPHAPVAIGNGAMQYLFNYTRLIKWVNSIFNSKHTISHAVNGGFSLRKTRKCYILLKLLKSKALKWQLNEDMFFNYWGNIFYPWFKLPSDGIAIKFSIETSPKESLESSENVMPFGCHAFMKYDWEIWKPHINEH